MGDEIYYGLHLTDTGTTIMCGEFVEVLGTDSDHVILAVPNDESACAQIGKAFFKRNFASAVTRESSKESYRGEERR